MQSLRAKRKEYLPTGAQTFPSGAPTYELPTGHTAATNFAKPRLHTRLDHNDHAVLRSTLYTVMPLDMLTLPATQQRNAVGKAHLHLMQRSSYVHHAHAATPKCTHTHVIATMLAT